MSEKDKSNRFKYFEDFNSEIQEKFLKINFQAMYILRIQIVAHEELESGDKNYLSNKTKRSLAPNTEIVKLYLAVSFYYTKCGDNNIECKKMTPRDELFSEEKIFPVITFSDFKASLEKHENEGWHCKYNENKSIIVIVKSDSNIENEKFDEIFDLHKDYTANSLIARNMSMKKSNAFIEKFKKEKIIRESEICESGFQPSLEITLLNLVKFISDKYIVKNEISSINLLKLTMNDKFELSWKNCRNFGDSAAFNENNFNETVVNEIDGYYFKKKDRGNSVNYAELKELALPKGFSANKEYYLIIPVAKSMGHEQFRYTLVLAGAYPFKTYILDNINSILAEYYSSYLETQKSELLLKLQKRLFERNIDFNGDVKENLRKLTEETFKKVVEITNAYSATFRLYDPDKKTLNKVVNEGNKEAEAEPDKEHKDISIIEYRLKSLNCRAFCLNEGEDCALYVPNTKKPRKSSKKGKKKNREDNEEEFATIPSRPQTLSELCVPFYYQGVVIGVMNFESPILRAFDNECEYTSEGSVKFNSAANKDEYVKLREGSFIYMVKSSLQHFYCLLSERNDIGHLSRLIETETSLHDLKNLVNTDADLNQFRKPIKQLLESATTLPIQDSKTSPVRDLLIVTRKNCIDAYYELVGDYAPILKESFLQKEHLQEYLPITFKGKNSQSMRVNSRIANSIKDIYKNLLRNYFNHGDIENDKLSVKYTEENGLLIIAQKFDPPLEPGTDWFLSPHIHKKGVSSGLFIIGTHVRQLGGYIFTQYDACPKRLKGFEIYINMGYHKIKEKNDEKS
jgi:hypothetical protein